MRIGLDLDGVVYDWVASMAAAAQQLWGREASALPPARTWDFWRDQWGFSLDEFLTLYREGVRAGVVFTHGGPYPGAREAVAQMRADGHTVHVVTDRGLPDIAELSQQATFTWLEQHGMAVDSVTFAADKTVVPTDVFIEDRVENYIHLDEAGSHPVLIDRPYNLHLPDARRVPDLPAFARYVRQLAAAPA